MWRLRYLACPQLAYHAKPAPTFLFPYLSEAKGWGTWQPWRMRPMSERLVWQRALISDFYIARYSRALGTPRRSFDGADHVWTVSNCYDHNGVPEAWFTGWRRRRLRTHVVVTIRFVVGALRCRVRFSRSRRVRTPHNHSLTNGFPATPNGGSRRLRSRSPIKQREDCSVP
jgi:hypothetical protein